jgi:hypothetical protein
MVVAIDDGIQPFSMEETVKAAIRGYRNPLAIGNHERSVSCTSR